MDFMLPQVTVDHYASGMRIDTSVAERDVVLTYVLKILDDVGLLQKLAFKGGTCLKKIYYARVTRFSEALDFTSLDSDDPNGLRESWQRHLMLKNTTILPSRLRTKI